MSEPIETTIYQGQRQPTIYIVGLLRENIDKQKLPFLLRNGNNTSF